MCLDSAKVRRSSDAALSWWNKRSTTLQASAHSCAREPLIVIGCLPQDKMARTHRPDLITWRSLVSKKGTGGGVAEFQAFQVNLRKKNTTVLVDIVLCCFLSLIMTVMTTQKKSCLLFPREQIVLHLVTGLYFQMSPWACGGIGWLLLRSALSICICITAGCFYTVNASSRRKL